MGTYKDLKDEYIKSLDKLYEYKKRLPKLIRSTAAIEDKNRYIKQRGQIDEMTRDTTWAIKRMMKWI